MSHVLVPKAHRLSKRNVAEKMSLHTLTNRKLELEPV